MQNYQNGDFALVLNNQSADIYYDAKDFKVVEIAANDLAGDIKNVTGIPVSVYTEISVGKNNAIIAGTIGHNRLIDSLIKEGRIDTAGISGKWETFAIQIVEKPTENIPQALVIFGSDRRGTAFGIYELSKQIGVSPWYWWADVPIQKKSNLIIKNGSYSDGPPSVKYRGIFINDEDWGLKPWASKTYDPELGDIGPKTYKKIFELLLRLKANHCWPAMHDCTKPFNYFKENKEVADDYAIVMGSSHCEPLLFNNASEWNKKTMGEWRYDTNKETIIKVLDKRVSENSQFENVYTIGMRGLHDESMRGNLRLEDQISLLEKIFADERNILTKYIDKKITEIPQVFIPYKEVLTLYNNNLKVPDDVTIMWVDDNFGYIRRLSDPIERKRAGGSGVYYHLSYLGPPHEYLWLFSTSPALIWEEMTKAYYYNARKIWIANVGDIKPCEYGMTFFLDLAWNINIVNCSNISSHLYSWLVDIFGPDYTEELTAIMKQYFHLTFERKVEHMSFGEQFSFHDWSELWEDTEYSFVNYREAERRLNRFQDISNRAVKLEKKIPEHLKPAYFQLVYYPVVAANYMNQKILLAQKNRWYAKQGRNKTGKLAQQVHSYYDSIKVITEEYNNLLNGKWKYMMSWEQHHTGRYYQMPPMDTIKINDKAEMGVFIEGNNKSSGISYFSALPCFNSIYPQKHYFEIYNMGNEPFKWKATADQKWIRLSESEGQIVDEDRIWVNIDWNLIPKQEAMKGTIEVAGAGRSEIIHVQGFNPLIENKEELKGLFVEDNGIISISAENYHRKIESSYIEWKIINDLGLTGKSVGMFPVTALARGSGHPSNPHLEYDFYTFNSGIIEMRLYVLPVFPINSFRGAFYSVSIDDDRPQMIDISVPEYSAQWKDNVRRNSSVNITRHYIAKPGKHTLKVWKVDTGMVFDKIVIDLGGLKLSYIGPEETVYK